MFENRINLLPQTFCSAVRGGTGCPDSENSTAKKTLLQTHDTPLLILFFPDVALIHIPKFQSSYVSLVESQGSDLCRHGSRHIFVASCFMYSMITIWQKQYKRAIRHLASPQSIGELKLSEGLLHTRQEGQLQKYPHPVTNALIRFLETYQLNNESTAETALKPRTCLVCWELSMSFYIADVEGKK